MTNEATYGGYARVIYPNDSDYWQSGDTTRVIKFPEATSSVGSITHWAMCDAFLVMPISFKLVPPREPVLPLSPFVRGVLSIISPNFACASMGNESFCLTYTS